MKLGLRYLFLSGIISGILLTLFGWASLQFTQRSPGYFNYYPAPMLEGALVITMCNSSKQTVGAAMLLNGKTIMTGLFKGRGIMTPPQTDYGCSTACSLVPGKHIISVVLGDVGEIGRHEFYQEEGRTNHVYIYIQNSNSVTNRFGCKILVYTNHLGKN
ncbi:MAG: hypothetical protein WCJ07_02410 [Verrucomicrobiota bacterium]